MCTSCEKLSYPEAFPKDVAGDVNSKIGNLSIESKQMICKIANWVASLPSENRPKTLLSLTKALENMALIRTQISVTAVLQMLEKKKLLTVNEDKSINYLIDK